MNADVAAPATREKIRQDVVLGQQLRIDSIPAVFINGRRVRTLGFPSLAMIIEQQRRRANRYHAL